MKYLRKKGTVGPVFIYHEQLARRTDMEVCDGPGKSPKAAGKPAKSVESDESDDSGDETITIDPLEITDKAELKTLLADRGVKVSGNPSLKTLQEKLAEALADESE